MLRKIFLIDGYVMIAVGLLLAGPFVTVRLFLYAGGPLSIPYPPRFWPNVVLDLAGLGVFSPTYLCYGFASVAVGRSRNSMLQRKAARYALAGRLLLALIVGPGVLHVNTWLVGPGFVLFDLLVWPIPALLYVLLPQWSAGVPSATEMASTDQEIREAAGQEERNRLAQDLHDSVKQQIYSVQTNLATAEARWENDAAGARSAIGYARSAAREAMTEMSALLDRLRRDPVESIGLVEALRRQCQALGFQTGSTVSTSFGDLPPASSLPAGAIWGHPHVGFRFFISTTARIRSAVGPFGPGFVRCLEENNNRYFR
jgi:signal transduction histidine kinase